MDLPVQTDLAAKAPAHENFLNLAVNTFSQMTINIPPL